MVDQSFFISPLLVVVLTEQLVKNYVDTGKVKFVYEQYPLPFHPNAQPAAMAAECANEQGKFWPMHDKLYATQTTWENQDAATIKKTFKEYAVSLGLNAASFNSCHGCLCHGCFIV